MAYSQIKGLTLEIGGDTTKLSKALSDVNKDLRTTQSDLNAVNRALKLDPTNVELLANKQELLGKQIDQTRRKLDTLKQAYQQNLSNPDVGEDEMKALEREINIVQASLNHLEGDYRELGNTGNSSTQSIVDNMQDVSKATDDASEGFTVLKGTIADLSAGAVKDLASSVKDFAVDSTQSYNKFQAQTGASAEEMELFKAQINDLYKNNYGESLEDIGDKMAYIKQVTGETDPDAIKRLTKNAIVLEDTFGSDFNETVRGVANMTKAFGISADEAFDLFAKGSQEGLDFSDELGDNVAEYGTKFAQAGYSAQEYFELLKNGTEGGAYNLDKVNDSINEVTTRLADGTIEESIGLFSSETQSLFNDWKSGKGSMKDVVNSIVSDIASCTDQQEALTMASKAFGTMGDDFGVDMVKNLTSLGDTMDNTKGKMEEIDKIRYDDVGSQFEALGRQFQLDVLAPLAETVLPSLKRVGQDISGIIASFSNWWGSLSNGTQDFLVKAGGALLIIGPLAGALGGLFNVVKSFSSVAGGLVNTFGQIGSSSQTLTTVSQTAQTTGQSLQTAGQGISQFAQNALGLLAIGGAIGLAGVGFKLLADSAVELANAGAGSVGVMMALVVGVGGLAIVMAKVGQSLTPAAAGMLSFGAAVLMIGGGIGLATAGIGYLISNLPALAESGDGVAKALASIGQGIVTMSTETITVLPELLTLATTLAGLALAIGGVDLATGALGVTATIGAGGVIILAGAMSLLAKSVKSIATNATKAADSIKYINDSVSVIESGVNGLKSVVKDGLSAIVDAFSSESTTPVDAWTQSLSALHNTTTTQMASLKTSVRNTIKSIRNMFANASLQFSHNIQVPHFSMSGAFDAKAGTVPTVNVNWYKNGGIFNSPSVIGVGEAGTEAVVPLDKLDSYVNSGNDKMLAIMSSMLKIMERYMPAGQQVVLDTGALVGEITPAIDDELGVRANRKGRQS